MADPVYTFGIELQTGSFTDVTTRVERGSWGQTIVDMFNPPRVGRAMFELANDDGLMGPRVNSSFQPGRNIQLTVVCSAITYALFYGKITDISLRSTLGARTTIVEAEDDWARLQDLRWTTKLYSGTNAKSLFCELMSLTTVRSFQIDAVNITSDHRLAMAWYQDMPAVAAMHEFVSAGNYQLLVDGAGTYQLRGRNWSRFDVNSTPTFDVSSWATAFRSSMSRNSIFNRIRLSGAGFLDATAPSTVVFMPTDNPYFLAPGVSIGFVFDYSNPNWPQQELICGSIVAMVQSQDWYVAANADGTGTDISSNWTLTTSFFAASGVATYTSNSLQGWLVRSQARGYPMIPTGPVYGQVDIASSQTAFGVRAFSMTNRLLQFQASDYIRSLATHIASDRKDGMHEAQITLTNQFWVQYLNDSLGNIIYVIDPFSGVPTTWRTRSTNHELDFTQGLRHVTTYELDTPQSAMGWGLPTQGIDQVYGHLLMHFDGNFVDERGGSTAAVSATTDSAHAKWGSGMKATINGGSCQATFLNAIPAASKWTVEIWVQESQVINEQSYSLVNLRNTGLSYGAVVAAARWNGANTFIDINLSSNGTSYDITAAESVNISASNVISDGAWHHFACCSNGTDRRIYWDGVLKKTWAGVLSTFSLNYCIPLCNVTNQYLDEHRVVAYDTGGVVPSSPYL